MIPQTKPRPRLSDPTRLGLAAALFQVTLAVAQSNSASAPGVGAAATSVEPKSALRLSYVHERDLSRMKGNGVTFGTLRKDAPPLPPEGKSTAKGTLTIGPGFSTRENEKEIVHLNFATHRMMTVNKEAKVVRDDSLHAAVAFREAERVNRQKLGELLSKAGARAKDGQEPDIARSLFNREELDALFGILSDPDQPPPLELKVTGDRTETTVRGKSPASWSGTLVRIPESLQPTWALQMRYTVSIHPVALAKLLEAALVPRELRFETSNNGSLTKHVIRFESADSVPPTTFAPPAEFKPDVDPKDEIDQLIAKTRAEFLAGKRLDREGTLKAIRERIDAGKFLDAFLAGLDLTLGDGNPDADLMRDVITRGAGEEPLQTFLKGMEENDPKKKEALFAGIKRDGLTYSRHIDIMLAVSRMLRRDRNGARELYLKALRESPMLAGPWHDLGGMDLNQFRHERAWRSWDLARLIAPGHPMLEPVNRFEVELRRRRPEFYLASESP